MTDNEIIKVIEKCASIGESCEDCPFYEYTDCDKRLKECFHDMLNRQKAEIERLKKTVVDLNANITDLIFQEEKAKSEAIKEFAERLKGYAKELKIGDNIYLQVVGAGRIDNLVKEMEGGTDE